MTYNIRFLSKTTSQVYACVNFFVFQKQDGFYQTELDLLKFRDIPLEVNLVVRDLIQFPKQGSLDELDLYVKEVRRLIESTNWGISFLKGTGSNDLDIYRSAP